MEPIRPVVREPGDIITVLPYVLGYQPRDSLVVLAVEDGALGVVMRVDLPPLRHTAAAVRQVCAPLARAGVRTAFVIVFESEPGAGAGALVAAYEHLPTLAVDIVDAYVVTGERWRASSCPPGCHGDEGHDVPDPADVAAVAELVAGGAAPVASRAQLAEQFAPDVAAGERVERALDTLLERGASPGREPWLWRRVLDPEGAPIAELDDGAVARLVLSLLDVDWRDGIVAWLCPSYLPLDVLRPGTEQQLQRHLVLVGADQRRAVAGRLAELARRVPDSAGPGAAALLSVLALLHWGGGDGATAREAVDRGLRAWPEHRLCRLTEAMLDHGVRPDTVAHPA